MKFSRVNEHVWSLRSWRLLTITVWLVQDEHEGLTLVDTGMGWMAAGIREAVEGSFGGSPLRRILLTHGHTDHVGSLLKLREFFPEADIYGNERELRYLEGQLPYPGRSKSMSSALAGLVKPLPERNGQLLPIGGLQPYWTPGHSPGHTVYYQEQDRVVLAGDLFTSSKGKLKPPMKMFTPDMNEALASSEVVRELKPEWIEVCHGTSVPGAEAQLEDYQKRWLPAEEEAAL